MNIPHSLAQSLAEGKVIPFVGAGVSMSVLDRKTGRPLFPGWRELLERAAARLEGERDRRKASHASVVRGLLGIGGAENYLEAARHAREGLGASWYGFLKTQLDPPRQSADGESLETARAVWGLGSRLVVTTNFDRVLHWACPEREELSYWSIEAAAEQIEALRGPTRRPSVWHLHGFIDKATDIILTPGGYGLLYPTRDGAEGKYRAALAALRAYLATHSFLFVGFGLEDAHFVRQLAEVHEIFQGAPGPHYALVHAEEEARVRALGLPVELVTFEDFGPPLVKLLREMGEAAAPRGATEDEEGGAAGAPVAVAPPAYGPHNTPFSVPFAPKGEQFVGREELLLAVHEQLTRGTRTALGRTAALLGLGGLGKTQLAVEYAFRHRDDYPGGVVWLNADQDIEAQLVELAERARWVAPEVEHKFKLDVARRRVQSHPDCLVIFDNLEALDAVRAYMPKQGVESYLLVTSRTEQPDFVSVPLNPLDKELSFRLLTQEAKQEPSGEAERRAADEIVEALGGLPLALELAGAYLRNRPVGWAQYRDLLRHDFKSAVPYKFYGGGGTRHDADLYATLRMSEEAVAGEPLLVEILDVLTWSGTAPMGYSLLRALLGDPDIGPLTDALGLGCALRLLQKTPGADSYAIHRLVRQQRRSSTTLDDCPEWVDTICQKLGKWFEGTRTEFTAMLRFEAEVNHLNAWYEHALHFAPGYVCRLTWLQAYPSQQRGDYKESRRILEKAYQLFEKEKLGDRELEVNLFHDFCAIETVLGDYALAFRHGQKALITAQELFGEDGKKTGREHAAISKVYVEKSQHRHALEHGQKALAISRSTSDEPLHVTVALNQIAVSYRGLGNYKEAIKHWEECLEIQKAVYGYQHPFTAALLSNMGLIHADIGDYDSALKFSLDGLNILYELGMDSRPEMVGTLNIIGVIYLRQKQYELAIDYLERCLPLSKTLLGDLHQRTVMAASNLADALYFSGRRRDEALHLIEEYVHKLPKEHAFFAYLKNMRRQILSQPVRPGFRQSSGKKQRKKKR
jgi:tetratricopeptide (TPR) repeat protein